MVIDTARNHSKYMCNGPTLHVFPFQAHTSVPELLNAHSVSATETKSWVLELLSQHKGAAGKQGQLFSLLLWVLSRFQNFLLSPKTCFSSFSRIDRAFYILTYKPAARGLGPASKTWRKKGSHAEIPSLGNGLPHPQQFPDKLKTAFLIGVSIHVKILLPLSSKQSKLYGSKIINCNPQKMTYFYAMALTLAFSVRYFDTCPSSFPATAEIWTCRYQKN